MKHAKKQALSHQKHKQKIPGIKENGHQKEDVYQNVFSRQTIWFVHVITICVRIFVVCQRENWWLLHPDEVYQSIEGEFFCGFRFNNMVL